MKAQRRHELKENDLAHFLHLARDYVEGNGKRIGAAVIILALVFITVALVVRSRTVAVEDVWRRKSQLVFDEPEVGRQSLASLAALRQEVSSERFALDSLIDEGLQGLRLASMAPAPPDAELNETARAAFEKLRQRFSDNPLAFGIAHNGLATVEENAFLLDGDISRKERAREHLRAIVENPALNAMPIKRLAMERLERLDEVFTLVTLGPPAPVETADVGPSIPIEGDGVEVFTDPIDPSVHESKHEGTGENALEDPQPVDPPAADPRAADDEIEPDKEPPASSPNPPDDDDPQDDS